MGERRGGEAKKISGSEGGNGELKASLVIAWQAPFFLVGDAHFHGGSEIMRFSVRERYKNIVMLVKRKIKHFLDLNYLKRDYKNKLKKQISNFKKQ